jgi:hypothetical protein
MSSQNGKKRNTVHSKAETVGTWKCYRCNLIFHDDSLVFLHEDISSHSAVRFLHEDISSHSAVRVEYEYGISKLIRESLGLVVENFTNYI